jgi:hypothetical protein
MPLFGHAFQPLAILPGPEQARHTGHTGVNQIPRCRYLIFLKEALPWLQLH